MTLTLIRHGYAHPQSLGDSDANRRLTPLGEKNTKILAQFLKNTLATPPEIILCSPYLRTTQTAQILAKENDWILPIPQDFLASGMTPEDAREGILHFSDKKNILLVGHNPDLTYFTTNLLGARENSLLFHPGSAAILETSLHLRQGRLIAFFPTFTLEN